MFCSSYSSWFNHHKICSSYSYWINHHNINAEDFTHRFRKPPSINQCHKSFNTKSVLSCTTVVTVASTSQPLSPNLGVKNIPVFVVMWCQECYRFCRSEHPRLEETPLASES
jgi:hypothetical protein